MELTATPPRAVLRGVPRVHFYEGGKRCPEDVCFPSVLRAILEYLGENVGCQHCHSTAKDWGLRCSYAYFTLVTGLGWQMSWQPGYGGDAFALLSHLSPDASEPFRRAFDAAGYEWEFVPREAGEAAMVEKIRASITEKLRPVIAFGVIGPPEAGLVTGYDEEGAVLLGWNFFQNDPNMAAGAEFEGVAYAMKDPCAGEEAPAHSYYRKRNWYPETSGLLIVGDKVCEPKIDEVYMQSLRWGVELLRAAEINGLPAGLAAYDAWAADLRNDALLDGANEAALRQKYETHNFMVGNLAEVRWYASVALSAGVEKVHYKHAEQLYKAAGCFAGEHEAMWQMWDLAGGIGNPDGWQMWAQPEVRREMARVVEESRARAEEAVRQIELTLSK